MKYGAVGSQPGKFNSAALGIDAVCEREMDETLGRPNP